MLLINGGLDGYDVDQIQVENMGQLQALKQQELEMLSELAAMVAGATGPNGVVFVNASSGEVDVTLYTADSNGGMQVIVKKTDSSSNAVNILRAGSDTIDGTTSVAILHQNESVTLVSDNSNWFIV